jgi:hypothetical protein
MSTCNLIVFLPWILTRRSSCAHAVTGHAAALPSPAMNSRRCICHLSKPLYRQATTCGMWYRHAVACLKLLRDSGGCERASFPPSYRTGISALPSARAGRDSPSHAGPARPHAGRAAGRLAADLLCREFHPVGRVVGGRHRWGKNEYHRQDHSRPNCKKPNHLFLLPSGISHARAPMSTGPAAMRLQCVDWLARRRHPHCPFWPGASARPAGS